MLFVLYLIYNNNVDFYNPFIKAGEKKFTIFHTVQMCHKNIYTYITYIYMYSCSMYNT